jgi:hypothetical protein
VVKDPVAKDPVFNSTVLGKTVLNNTVLGNTVLNNTVARDTAGQAIPAFSPGRRRLARAARAGRQYLPRRRSGAR